MPLRRRIARYLIDALAVVLAGGYLASIWVVPLEGPRPVLIAAGLAATLPLLARRRLPLAAPAAAPIVLASVSFVSGSAVPEGVASLAIMMVAAGLIGTIPHARPALAGLALVLGCIGLIVWNDPSEDAIGDLAFVCTLSTLAWVAGVAIGQGGLRASELERRVEAVEAQREERALTAVAEERNRIAREMHDVVAHSLSVMVVQAGAAETMLDVDPERARRPLAAVQSTGREALTDLRRVLGALREGDDEPRLTPQTGLAGLDALVAHVRDAGLPVDLEVQGIPRPLPAGVDLSAFRIVQEGLTNALKHAGPARAWVALRYGDDELAVAVEDDGLGARARGRVGANGGGHGLVGMRERVALYGGELDAAPRPEGGFALRARLPLSGGPDRARLGPPRDRAGERGA